MSKFLVEFSGLYSQQQMEAMCTDIYNDMCADTVSMAMDQARSGNISQAIDTIDSFVTGCRNPAETYRDMLMSLFENAAENPHVHVVIDHDVEMRLQDNPIVHVSLTKAKQLQEGIRQDGGNATIYSVMPINR